jgi:proteasome lid subunit RPN8/RPN11
MVRVVLNLDRAAFDAICDLAIREYPLEMCGLIAGPPGDAAALRFYPCRNVAESAKLYTIDPTDHYRAELDADDRDWEIIGVVHSHTHSEPYPSPTDVNQAPDPAWHYVIVSLKREAPELRSYRIVAGQITEEPVTLS